MSQKTQMSRFRIITARVYLASLFVILLSGITVAVPIHWTIESGGNGHWYEPVYVPGGISWTDARDTASSILPNGYLATISSATENSFVFSLIDEDKYWYYDTPNGGSFGPWLGGTDDGTEGNWRWITGEIWDYTNWHSSQPDNWAGIENYLHFYWNAAPLRETTWNDLANWPLLPITAIKGYVVETIPEPLSIVTLLCLITLGRFTDINRKYSI